MTDNFPTALALVLRYEGGYSNVVGDHGGATMRGVTQAVYSSYLKDHARPDAAVRDILDADVAAIYRKSYWDACACDRLPHPLCIAVMDAAVNSGPYQAAKWLQRALNVPVDGAIGPRTLASAAACDVVPTTRDCIDQREVLLRALATRAGQAQFLKGWLSRIADLRRVCGV